MGSYPTPVETPELMSKHSNSHLDHMNISTIELIPSEDAPSKPSGENGNQEEASFFSQLGDLVCFNRTVQLERPFPVSLQLLVNYFRVLTGSFSGCLFVESPASSVALVETPSISGRKPVAAFRQSHHEIDEKAVFSLNDWQWSMMAKRLLLILLNLCTIAYFSIPLVSSILEATRGDSGGGNSTSNGSTSADQQQQLEGSKQQSNVMEFIEMMEKNGGGGGANDTGDPKGPPSINLGIISMIVVEVAMGHQKPEDLTELKPILRMIMQWLVYVYMLNGLASAVYNLLLGGSFLRHLLRIREFSLIDRSRRLAALLIGADLAVVLAIKAGVIWAYQWNDIQVILFSGVDEKAEAAAGAAPDPMQQFLRQVIITRFSIETALSIFQTLFLTLNTLLFVYSMTMFRWAVEQLQEDVKRANELDELQLSLLKTRLFRLNEAFKRTVRYFSVPVTLDLLACTYMLIGSSCFLIINQNRDNISPYAIGFIAKIGLLALVRLVVVASAGNFSTNACNTLIRLVYEAKSEWTLQEWLCYLEIKRAPAEFIVSMFSVYTVQQSSILVVLGFSLNYIVVLLQTESYGSAQGNSTANITDKNMTG